jgi:ribosome-binding protein aMBF1 (putative translation factor)
LIKNLFVLFKIIHGVFIPTCTICEKKITIPFKAIIGGPILDVCESCLVKYGGKKIEVTDVHKIIIHTDLIRAIEIKS